jgi:hypothetical protein
MLEAQVRLLTLWWSARDTFGTRTRARGDDGMTTETVIITAALAALALAVMAIIVPRVTGKAESIDLGG